MDIRQFLSKSFEDLLDSEKDELFSSILLFDLEQTKISWSKMKLIFKLTQGVLRYKGEQVDSLLLELDEIAAKQGEEEAQTIDTFKRTASVSSAEFEDLKSKYDNLKMKFSNKNSDIQHLTQENEKLLQEVNQLERDKTELQHELQSAHHDSSSDNGSDRDRRHYEEVTEAIRIKNKQISQLITDAETSEKDNKILREKVTMLRDDLSDATQKIVLLTDEISTLRDTFQIQLKNSDLLEEKNTTLQIQIDQLIKEKEQQNTEIDQFSVALDKRVEEWKNIIDEKNKETEDWKTQYENIKSQMKIIEANYNQNQIVSLMKTVEDNENTIEELQKQLTEATTEMNEIITVMEQLKKEQDKQSAKIEDTDIVKQLQFDLKNSNEYNQELESRVKFAEEDSRTKSEEVADLLARIKKYEEGQYGLKEAITQVKDLEKQIKIREDQIEKLVQKINTSQTKLENYELENIALKDKMGLSADTIIPVEGVVYKQNKLMKRIQKLQNQLEKMEEEKVENRLDNHKLSQVVKNLSAQITKLGDEPDLKVDDLMIPIEHKKTENGKVNEKYKSQYLETEERLQEAIVENEALRKGLHEILNSIHEHDKDSELSIKSVTLERLLKALDIRHVSGWYHPAMRLQAELISLQGTNSELREQLRMSKQETQQSLEKLQTLQVEIEKQRQTIEMRKKSDLDDRKINEEDVVDSDNPEVISNLNTHLLKVVNEHQIQEEQNKKLKENLKNYRTQLNSLKKQLDLVYKNYDDEKSKWKSEIENLNEQNMKLKETAEVFESQLNEIRDYWNVIEKGGGEAEKNYVDLGKRCTEIVSENVQLHRKCLFMEYNETKQDSDLKKVKQDMLNMEVSLRKKLENSKKTERQLSEKIDELEKKYKNYISIAEYHSLKKEFDDVSLKYKNAIEAVNIRKNYTQQNIEILEVKCKNLTDDKNTFMEKFNSAQAQLLVLQGKIMSVENKDININEKIAKQLADSELHRTSESQRADHLENLYKVVQDQIKRSEEQRTEVITQNNFLRNKNLELQKSLCNLEDTIFNSVKKDIYNEVILRNDQLETKLNIVTNENDEIKQKYSMLKKEMRSYRLWKHINQNEMLSLKHQIVDLQAVTDDKALIARLSTEVVYARVQEADYKNKAELLEEDLNNMTSLIEQKKVIYENKEQKLMNDYEDLMEKYRNLENILNMLRHRYYGFSPLSSIEHLFNIINEETVASQKILTKMKNLENIENDLNIIKEEFLMKEKHIDELKNMLENNEKKDMCTKIMQWYRDRDEIKLKELRTRRQIEFKDQQLQQAFMTLKKQENIILEFETELLKSNNMFIDQKSPQLSPTVPQKLPEQILSPTPTDRKVSNLKSAEVQTHRYETKVESTNTSIDVTDYNQEINKLETNLSQKILQLNEYETKVIELEKINSMLKKELVQKQEELLNVQTNTMTSSNDNAEQIKSMKAVIIDLQKIITQKEDAIIRFQNLLKEEKDEHSRAAERFQTEIQALQAALLDQQQVAEKIPQKQYEAIPEEILSESTVKNYTQKVHELEIHIDELHTAVHSLNSQLLAAKQEANRWRTLSEDRLKTMDDLRAKLEEQHRLELDSYKIESTRWKEEANNFKKEMLQLQIKVNQESANSSQMINKKEMAIQELETKLNELEIENQHYSEAALTRLSPQVTALEVVKKQLQTDCENLKKQLSFSLNREKSAREEIRNLRGQLIKRPVLSARSDRSVEKISRDELKKKISSLETELYETKKKLEKEISITEARRAKNAEDLALWDKLKRWQQTAEKVKEKLKLKSDEYEKLQQTNSSLKNVVSRLEREKYILEGKLKAVRGSQLSLTDNRLEMLKQENDQLRIEIEVLNKKIEMQQHHSGGLGATLMEEKLEAQERKIAILELAAKGGSQVTMELERLQNNNTLLQKENVQLQAANLELSLELEKVCRETPRLKEQVEHLEKYVAVLKAENSQHETLTTISENSSSSVAIKKQADLEKTVYVLRRVIERLQNDNKKLSSGKTGDPLESKIATEKLKSELFRIKDLYKKSNEKAAKLERELEKANKQIKLLETTEVPEKLDVSDKTVRELNEVKRQLQSKNQLLNKVKLLLHRAANKEKALDDQIKALKKLVPPESLPETLSEESNPSSLI